MKKILLVLVISLLLSAFSIDGNCACDFNGGADYIDCGYTTDYDIGTNWSVSWWMYLDSVTGEKGIISRHQQGTQSASTLYIKVVPNLAVDIPWVAGSIVDSGVAVTINEWHHYALTKAGTTWTIWKDGVLWNSSVSAATPTNDSDETLYIGEISATFIYSTDGQITEVAWWKDVALTQDEISLLASSIKRMPLQIQPANLKLYLPLDDHTSGTGINGKTYNDMSGNGNDGTGVDADADSTNVGEEILNYPPAIGQFN